MLQKASWPQGMSGCCMSTSFFPTMEVESRIRGSLGSLCHVLSEMEHLLLGFVF